MMSIGVTYGDDTDELLTSFTRIKIMPILDIRLPTSYQATKYEKITHNVQRRNLI